MIGGGPIMEDEGNLTVQNPSGRQPLCFRDGSLSANGENYDDN